jgi:hypothetical protein
MYFSTPSFCPLIVLVFSENLNLSACFFLLSPASPVELNNASPEVTDAVFNASLLFILDVSILLQTNNL